MAIKHGLPIMGRTEEDGAKMGGREKIMRNIS